MLLKDWIRKSRTKAGMTQQDLGNVLGVTRANVSAWEHGLHEPNFEVITRLSALSGEPLPFPAPFSAAPLGVRSVPLLTFVQAGSWANMGENEKQAVLQGAESVAVNDNKLSPRAFALQVRGDEMYPVFVQGDHLIIDPEVVHRNNDFVIATIGEDEAVCRQYRIRGQDEQRNAIFELRSMNPSLYPAIRSDELPITIIGKVVRIERRLP
jgi:SOS-response transcriptional repressor LexA